MTNSILTDSELDDIERITIAQTDQLNPVATYGMNTAISLVHPHYVAALVVEVRRLRLELEGREKAYTLMEKGMERLCEINDGYKQENRRLCKAVASFMVWTEHSNVIVEPEDREMLELARKALESCQARKGEDVWEWARKLAREGK